MTDEAIVLAGGLGTRLRAVVKDVPKPMAEVNGQPFLDYILDYLIKNKITKVVLAVGYKHEIIQNYLSQNKKFSDLQISYSIENQPLGTGGAISQAITKVDGSYTFIVNGDTFFNIPLNQLEIFAHKKNAEIAIALKELPFSNRYGRVACSSNDRILSFSENKHDQEESCLINGGTYFINKNLFEPFELPQKFSLENDFFKPYLKITQAYGKCFEDFFIDIGIPEDYNLAQKIFKNGSNK
ncbi:nucleotidyltransferase family protein [Pricia sp. S334]|uniref:Nucleotidyltransferase family protein n=1 Tax=Pricia mediterranea TaxID=3076079 RepID=A0ABU3L2W8_9FLAO|nr:nucleotidyltransferase family protein [Pricia sp. S334]MDT7828085.1 nucleotidyltransferase family protein [Pricia sp. S334]